MQDNPNNRMGFLGGSDIAAVLGMSRWQTPLGLWMIKTGAVQQEDLSDVEAVEMGQELEEVVARMFTKRTGMKVRRPNVSHYVLPGVNWARAQVDRLVEGTDELLECKTCSAFKLKEWDGESIPQEYILQVCWQLLVTGRKVGWIAVLIGGQKFLYKKIEADNAFNQWLLEKATEFWKMVQDGTMPSATYGDDDNLLALHPTATDQIQALQEFEVAVARRQELSQQIKDMTEEKDEIEVKIKEAVGDNLGFRTENYLVKWSPTKSSRIDIDSLKSAGIYEQYCKESSSRRLTIKLNKPEGK